MDQAIILALHMNIAKVTCCRYLEKNQDCLKSGPSGVEEPFVLCFAGRAKCESSNNPESLCFNLDETQ